MRILLIFWLFGLVLAWFWVRARRKQVLRLLTEKSPADARNFRVVQRRFGIGSGYVVAHLAGDQREVIQAQIDRIRIKVVAAWLGSLLWPILPALVQMFLGNPL